MSETISAYPLCWPAGWKRTAPEIYLPDVELQCEGCVGEEEEKERRGA